MACRACPGGARDTASRTWNGLRSRRKMLDVPVPPPVWGRVSEPAGPVEVRPRHDSRSPVRQYVLQAQSVLLGAWPSVRLRLHRTSSYRPKPLPVLRWVDNLRPWRPSASLPNSKTVPRGLVPSLRYGLDLNGLRRDASVWAVLFVILLFLVIEIAMHDSSRYAGVTSVNTAQASAVPSQPTVASDATTLSKPQAGLRQLHPAGKATTRSAHRRRQRTHSANSSTK